VPVVEARTESNNQRFGKGPRVRHYERWYNITEKSEAIRHRGNALGNSVTGERNAQPHRHVDLPLQAAAEEAEGGAVGGRRS
jgi:hypothetical protein